MSAADEQNTNELERLALAKMDRVLGPDRARRLFARFVTEAQRPLRTAQDLLRLGDQLTALGGIEGAVGAMLGVAAVLRGAERKSDEGAVERRIG